MLLTERFAVAPLKAPADHQSAGFDASVNMSQLYRVTFLVPLGAITGNDTAIKVYSGATLAAKTTEIALHYRLTGADVGAAGADQFGDRTTVAAGGTGLVFTDAANYNDRLLAIDVDAGELAPGHEYVTLEVDDGSASGLFAACIAIGEPRYQANDVPTVVA